MAVAAPEPKVLAVVSTKGGTGKTLTAMHLAFAAARAARRYVLVLDVDPAGGAALWGDELSADNPEVIVEAAEVADLRKPWQQWRRRSRHRWPDERAPALVVLDTPPADHRVMEAAVRAADFVVIPTATGLTDVFQAQVTFKAAQNARKPAAILVTLADTRTGEAWATPEWLDQQGLPRFNTVIPRLIGLQRNVMEVPSDLGPYTQLWSELKGRLR